MIVSVVVEPTGTSADFKPVNALAVLITLAATVALAFRRTYPLGSFVAVAVCIVLLGGADFSTGAVPFLAVIGIYTVGAYCRPRQIAIAYALMLGSLVMLWIIDIPDFSGGDVFSNTMLYTAAVGIGWAVQSRRLRLEAAEERAEMLEREQDEERARAIADERLRIAQELHDVMAHSMSVIAVQAGVGMHVADTDAAEAKRALENISDDEPIDVGRVASAAGRAARRR